MEFSGYGVRAISYDHAAFQRSTKGCAGMTRKARLTIGLMLALAILPVTGSVSAAAQPGPTISRSPDEAALLEADARQRDAVANVDPEAIRRISHPNLRVNAPSNHILTREDLIRMVASGEIRNEVFERVPEIVTITGDVGVVMGHETVLPGAASEQARMYGRRTFSRRYTNIYLRVDGHWLHLARHANIMPAARAE
jgi:hypothetical protein